MCRLEFSSSPALSAKYGLHFQTELRDFYELFSPSLSLSLTPILKFLIHFHAYLVDPLSLRITRETSYVKKEALESHFSREKN